MAATRDTIELLIEILGKEGVDQLAASNEKLRDALEKTAAAGDKAAGKTANLGQSMLQTGRFVQDFSQGGIGGVLNNIEGLVSALGMGPGLAGALTVAGVGFALLAPKIREWMAATGEAEEKLKGFNDSLGKSREAVARLNAEAEPRVAALVREKEALDAVIEAHNRQAESLKKLRALQAAGTTEREQERAANLQALVGGRQGELVGEVAAGMATPEQRAGRGRARAEAQSEIERLEGILGSREVRDDPARQAWLRKMIAGQRRRLDSISATEDAERRRAEGLVAGAVVEGKEGALKDVLGRLPAGSKFRTPLEGQTNAALDQGDDDARAFDDHIERVQEATKERNQRARREKQEAARKKAEDARHAREAKADAKARAKAGFEGRADELLAHGPEIVGEAFGPRAAAMAANANPAEVREIKERTMRNLQEGQAPYAALLDAFREVSEASARNAQDTRRFAAQLNGVRGRIQPSSESPANFVIN